MRKVVLISFVSTFILSVLVGLGYLSYAMETEELKHFGTKPKTNTLLYPEVIQNSEGLYTAKIPTKNLYLVMERIDSENIELWQNYAMIQSNDRVIRSASCLDKSLRKHAGQAAEGSVHFKSVLDTVDYTKNEVWVAYISRNQKFKKIPKEMSKYSTQISPDFVKDIEMFVTVTTSPEALLTSHMGITFSFEHAKDRIKGVSLDLHSFAAKVMLQRNPLRKYMINAPAFAMEKLIVQALPKSVFVGTREMLCKAKVNLSQSYEEFRTQFLGGKLKVSFIPSPESIRESAKQLCKDLNRQCSQLSTERGTKEEESGQTVQSRMSRILEKNSDYYFDGHPAIEIQNHTFIVSAEKQKSYIEDVTKYAFEEYRRPLWLPLDPKLSGIPRDPSGLMAEIESLENFFQYMKAFPPLLSVDNEWLAHNKMSIFSPDDMEKPWLVLKKGDARYQWMFERPFLPSGSTHLIAVDLMALANVKKCELTNNQ